MRRCEETIVIKYKRMKSCSLINQRRVCPLIARSELRRDARCRSGVVVYASNDSRLYAGVDFGTSGVRLIVIDRDGGIKGQYVRSYGGAAPSDWASVWQASLMELIEEIPPEDKSGIRAISVDGTSATCMLADRTTGALLSHPRLYNEAQGPESVALIKAIAPANHTTTAATSTLAKLATWHLDGTVARLRAEGHDPILLHQADWALALLHGDYSGVSDWNNALKLGFDPISLEYGGWLLSDKRLAPLLPLQVMPPGTVQRPISPPVASRLGLPPTCRIVAGTTDSIAAFIACSGFPGDTNGNSNSTSGADGAGDAVTSLGSTLAVKMISDTPVEDARFGVYSHRLGDTWLVGGASNAGGAVLRRLFSDARLAELTGRMDAARETGLDYYPLAGKGERFPVYDPLMEPRLTPRPEDDALFLQGILEGLSRIEARAYGLLAELGASKLRRVKTAGGGSRNPVWTGIRRRLLGPSVRVEGAEQTEAAYGAALLARRGDS